MGCVSLLMVVCVLSHLHGTGGHSHNGAQTAFPPLPHTLSLSLSPSLPRALSHTQGPPDRRSHTVAVAEGSDGRVGEIYTWGSNTYGQLGLPGDAPRPRPVRSVVPPPLPTRVGLPGQWCRPHCPHVGRPTRSGVPPPPPTVRQVSITPPLPHTHTTIVWVAAALSVRMRARTHTHAYTRTHTHASARTHPHAPTHTRARTRPHACKHAQGQYLHTHTLMQPSASTPQGIHAHA